MTPKFLYFGKRDPSDIASMGVEGCFVEAGAYYDYRVEVLFDEGFVRIADSCGRYVPLDKVHYAGLLSAFEAIEDIQDAYDNAMSTSNRMMEYINQLFPGRVE